MTMVKVWYVCEGPEPTRGGPAYESPLATCIKTLGLRADEFLSGPERTPRFGDQSARLDGIADYRHVICEIEDAEAAASGWKPDHYRADVSPTKAIKPLGPPRKP